MLNSGLFRIDALSQWEKCSYVSQGQFMRRNIGECLLELGQGNIVHEAVEVIVNAANRNLIVGSGTDGAIHQAGGSSILEDLRRTHPNGCPEGQCVSSTAGNLTAKFIFHAVGPIWQGGRKKERELLQSTYRHCLKLATEQQCRSIAFPAISTGVFGYPIDRAANDSLETVIDFLKTHQAPALVRFVLFGPGAYGAFCRVLNDLLPET
ncbi:macro domain-containing protein [Planctomicrobium sp. SH527]|uniref:macro domain-containing protein n=1 Tax=Planctomicrobium sp. SH527 TaxID=3448123 RepID=UPI003F5AEE1D